MKRLQDHADEAVNRDKLIGIVAGIVVGIAFLGLGTQTVMEGHGKAAAHAEAKKIEPSVLIASRLYPDMFPLYKQVQIASDVAKIGTSRLAQVEPPKYEDNETTFPELIERLRKTIKHLETLKPGQFDDGSRMVTFPTQTEPRTWPGSRYFYTRVLPNVFFHCATGYNILRHNGVEIGKADFLGPLDG